MWPDWTRELNGENCIEVSDLQRIMLVVHYASYREINQASSLTTEPAAPLDVSDLLARLV